MKKLEQMEHNDIECRQPNNAEIASWEDVKEIIENENSYGFGYCISTHNIKYKGKPCQSGSPLKYCIWFGNVADYMVGRNYATNISKEKLYKLLGKYEKTGPVHFWRNCCKCLCFYLEAKKSVSDIAKPFIEVTQFILQVDLTTCIGCGECVNCCEFGALHVSDKVVVNKRKCLGCGYCVSKCSTKSLTLNCAAA